MTDDVLKYWAFLSYSQQDNRGQRTATQDVSHLCWGDWLHDALQTFSIPAEFVGQINGRGETIPGRIHPIFQDTQEQPDGNLNAETRQALEQSKCLIVVCSPRSAASLHVNETVRHFKQLGRGKNIFPIVIAGEPDAGDRHRPGISVAEECFVPALRHPLRPDGTVDTVRRAGKYLVVDARHGADKREILAKDDRNAEADLEMAKIHLIAMVIGVAFNGLWWREQKRHFVDLAEARQQAREALDQVGEARRQLQEAEHRTREAENRVLQAQNLPGDVHGQIQEAQARALAAQEQAREARRQLEEFQNKARDTQSQLEEARHRVLAVESKCLEAQNQAREAQRQAEETQRQLQEAASRVQLQTQTVPAEIQEAQRQAEEGRRLIEELQNHAQQAQAQAREERSQAEEARRQLQEARDQVQEFQNQTQKARNQVEQTQNQSAETRNKIQIAQNQIRQARRLTGILALVTLIALLAASVAWWQRKNTATTLTKPAPEEPKEPDLTRIETNNNVPAPAFDNPTNALALLNDTKPVPSEETYALLFQRWATNDPAQAIEQRQQIPDHDADDNILCVIMAAWVNQQPDAAVNWVAAQPDSESKNKALETCIRELSKTDAPKALALTASLPEGTWRNTVIVSLFNGWAARDLEAATTAYQQLPDCMPKAKAWESILNRQIVKDPASAATDVTNLPAGDFRQIAIVELSKHWADTNTPAALAWAQSLPSGAEQTNAIDQVVAAWARQDPQAAMQYAVRQPGLSADALGEIAKACSANDLSAATNWVSSLPDREKKNTVLLALSTTWSQTDPQGMATYALGLPAGDVQTEYLTAACHQLAIGDFPETVELLKSLPDDGLRQNLLEQGGRDCDLPHVDQAAKYVAAMPAGDDQGAAISGLLAAWAPADPEAALNWLCAFPTNNLQTEQVQSVIKDWSQTAPAAVAKWLANLPAGTPGEDMVSSFLEGTAGKYPEFAGQWTGSVTNEASRQKYQVQVAREWMKTDPSAATNWLNSLDLPAELKQLK